jgi:2-keto-3-deoxy-L-rhamnonate aldolase
LGQLLLPALTVGAVGTIDAISGAFPKIYVDLFDAFQAGDLEKAKKLQVVVSRAEEIVVRLGVIGIKKTIYSQGFGESYLGRAPLNQDLVPGAWEGLADYYNQIQTLDASSK